VGIRSLGCDDHIGTISGSFEGDGLAYPTTGPRDEDGLPGEFPG